tara:strand:+ start:1537 stop:2025 length:489 start_codon:yes stop_codon:yes gene_type:complete
MGTFAKGRFAQAISDRSGQAFPYSEMVREWNGSLVHTSEYESKHPQLEPKPKGGDPEGLLNARPARTEPATPRLLNSNAFTSTASSTTVSVFEEAHGRTTGDTVCFRDVIQGNGINDANNTSGFTITVTNANNYIFTSTDTANTSGKFGGSLASAGPVTISS